jgi:RNA polymerase sigma factor (TIGR02999 family)
MEQTLNITQMLQAWSDGNRDALDEFLPLVYDELHQQAARFLRRERREHTLQTTALIHEAYIKLINQHETNCESRTHFFAIAANLMRQILVDYARAKHRNKRGGDAVKLSLNEETLVIEKERSIDLMALDEALTRLQQIDMQQAQVVELRYFGGMTLEETADELKISRTTVANDWNMAKAWLHRELTR